MLCELRLIKNQPSGLLPAATGSDQSAKSVENLLFTSINAGQFCALGDWSVSAAVTAVLHAHLLSQEKAHPADLDDLYAQTWHREIIGYKNNSFSNLTVLPVKCKKLLMMRGVI